MKNLVGRIVTSLLLSILALGSAAQGQRSEQIIQANIPFDFAVGSRFFPAGHYSLVRSQPWQLELRDSEGRVLVNLLTQSVQTSTAPDRPKLVFESAGPPSCPDPGLAGEPGHRPANSAVKVGQ